MVMNIPESLDEIYTTAPHPHPTYPSALANALDELIGGIEDLAQTTRVRSDHIAITRLHSQALSMRNLL
jgi:hypothetical protein